LQDFLVKVLKNQSYKIRARDAGTRLTPDSFSQNWDILIQVLFFLLSDPHLDFYDQFSILGHALKRWHDAGYTTAKSRPYLVPSMYGQPRLKQSSFSQEYGDSHCYLGSRDVSTFLDTPE
jgi:hypothetical protein